MSAPNPPAFPRPLSHDAVYRADERLRQGDSIDFEHAQEGMTLRDYFAAKAMSSFLGNTAAVRALEMETGDEMRRNLAESSYAVADAMLEARK